MSLKSAGQQAGTQERFYVIKFLMRIPSSPETSVFSLKTFSDWMKAIHIIEANVLYSKLNTLPTLDAPSQCRGGIFIFTSTLLGFSAGPKN